MKKFWQVSLSLIIVASLVLAAGCKTDPDPIIGNDPVPISGNVQALIIMESGAEISLELYPDIAPKTVTNFVQLAEQGFYDGLTFHRIIPNFMIQGGCPQGTGMGGPGHTIKGEFADNGHENNIKHERGVISMARAPHYDSAGSQFFIMDTSRPHLDGQYAAFGRVLSGMDEVDRIANADQVVNNLGQPTDEPITPRSIATITIIRD